MNMLHISKLVLLMVAGVAFGLGCASASGATKMNADVVQRYFQLTDAKKGGSTEVEDAKLVYTLPVGTMDVAGHSKLVQGFAIAFPNFKHTLSRCFESGDLVACEGKFSGDHTGPLAMPDGSTLPPTRKHVEFPFSVVARVNGGKLAEFNGYFDVLGFLGQLGVGPAASK